MRSLDILNNISVATPCNAEWNDMVGDDRVRHCQHCEKNVFNLSALKADDALALIKNTEGRLCGRFFRRQDGTIITADCPVGIRAALDKAGQSTVRALAMVFSLVVTGLVFFMARGGNPLGRTGCVKSVVKTVEKWKSPPPMMGEIAPTHVEMGGMEPPEEIKGDIALPEAAPEPVMGKVALPAR